MKDAIAIIIQKDNKFLLIKRANKNSSEDYWSPITGAVEKDEKQDEAVVREAKEEMGIVVKPIKKVWECCTQNKQYILHWWIAKQASYTITIDPSEVKEYKWVAPNDMNTLKMFKDDLNFYQNII